ncbi:MAG TPA: tagaturonate epimerase family protein [Bacteroidota bacterium]|nr:tagaturonate epimerase family protein [Bacteroidota bacterium]
MASNIQNVLIKKTNSANKVFPLAISKNMIVDVYPKSIQQSGNSFLFIGVYCNKKSLWITKGAAQNLFEGTIKNGIKQCPFNHNNVLALQKLFSFTKPSLLGQQNSIGCGDRLGHANAGHIRAVLGSGLKPVLAQQSVRELERTKREAEDVMDAAIWAVYQEGYKDGFGADADHLKTPEDIDRYAKAGFTMFTLDIGLYVVNEAARLPIAEVRTRAAALPWNDLQDTLDSAIARYNNQQFKIAEGFVIQPSEEDTLRSFVKYGAGIAQTVKLVNHLKTKWSHQPVEIELSVDETDTPTSPLEHFVIANELKRLGITLMSLAPRFIGDFEKGVEYKGDLKIFKDEYTKHVQIAEKLGPYKISIHSGSDKFDVYRVVGSIGFGHVHVKTAGTSWLEALRAIGDSNPALFRKILDCARENYDNDRKSYHVTADTNKLRPSKKYSDKELLNLLSDDNARQILHVTFGSILSKKDESGKYVFKDKIMKTLEDHEDVHNKYIVKHFRRHIEPIIR